MSTTNLFSPLRLQPQAEEPSPMRTNTGKRQQHHLRRIGHSWAHPQDQILHKMWKITVLWWSILTRWESLTPSTQYHHQREPLRAGTCRSTGIDLHFEAGSGVTVTQQILPLESLPNVTEIRADREPQIGHPQEENGKSQWRFGQASLYYKTGDEINEEDGAKQMGRIWVIGEERKSDTYVPPLEERYLMTKNVYMMYIWYMMDKWIWKIIAWSGSASPGKQ